MENDAIKLEEAVEFALECHRGGRRKGTDRPYILHPLEVLRTLDAMNADTNLMIAGLLHDTLEDTEATKEEILRRFGEDVGKLVEGHSEDKSKSWKERKQHTIDELPGSSLRHKILVLADKVSNLRDMYRDYAQVGEDFWKRFNASKDMQAWYFDGLLNGLSELRSLPDTGTVYREMEELCRLLFPDSTFFKHIEE